jgi:hypothetical protein
MHSNSTAKLPITLVIPSLASLDDVANHLIRLADLLPAVEKIVVVDSSGPDVLGHYREKLADFDAEVHERPRGLYQAWNFAISRASSEFVYFSTIGDFPHPGGVEHLLEVAKSTQADVVISPPQLLSADGTREAGIQWPVHHIVDALHTEQSPAVLSAPLAAILFSSFLPSSVLGSSASNLYRTSVLKDAPFPENCGPQGDVVWAFKMCARLRFAFTSQVCADFQLTPVHKQLEGQADASQRVFSELVENLETRFETVPVSADLSIARGWANCNWKHFKWTHEYVQWHAELLAWSEKLEKWNAFLEKRDKSLGGRIASIINRCIPFGTVREGPNKNAGATK